MLAARIEAAVPGVTASTRRAFARSERRVVGDMTTDIVRAMILVGFVIGVAVAGLVAYSATLSQLRDYAILRALGLRAVERSGSPSPRSERPSPLGFVLALALVWALAALLPALARRSSLAIRADDVAPGAGRRRRPSPWGRRRSRYSASPRRPGKRLPEVGDPRCAEPLVRIRSLVKTFGDGETRVDAVRDLDLELDRGEIVLVMGPSGSGKTTFLSMLGGLLRVTAGEIWIDGTDIAALGERELPPFRARSFGFIFQDFNLLAALSARENVEIALNIAGETRYERTRPSMLAARVDGPRRQARLPVREALGRREAAGRDRPSDRQPTGR